MTLVDDALVDAWLAGRPATTTRAYRREFVRLRAWLQGKPLGDVTLSDLRSYADTLKGFSARSQGLAIAAVKGFYTFHCRSETLSANPATFLKAPRIPSDLAERILTEDDTKRLLAGAELVEGVMLRLLYLAGLRASELCGLRWGDLLGKTDAVNGGKLSVLGKGGKRRTVIIPSDLLGDLEALRPDDASAASPVFCAERGSGPLGPRQLLRIVKRAAAAAGLSDKISCHWLRHCHASHAIDAGAAITLVRDTLGHSNLTITNRYAHARPNDGSARFLRTGG
jgi:integrase/recombinase XerD